MQNNKRNYPSPSIDDVKSVVSATDQTGLVQGLPESDAEMSNYAQIRGIPEQGALDAAEDEVERTIAQQNQTE